MATEKEDSYIEDVQMSNADNGVIISYVERCKRKGKGTYDAGYDYNRRQEVFDIIENEKGENEMEGEAEEWTEAFDRFKELFLQARKDRHKKSSNY